MDLKNLQLKDNYLEKLAKLDKNTRKMHVGSRVFTVIMISFAYAIFKEIGFVIGLLICYARIFAFTAKDRYFAKRSSVYVGFLNSGLDFTIEQIEQRIPKKWKPFKYWNDAKVLIMSDLSNIIWLDILEKNIDRSNETTINYKCYGIERIKKSKNNWNSIYNGARFGAVAFFLFTAFLILVFFDNVNDAWGVADYIVMVLFVGIIFICFLGFVIFSLFAKKKINFYKRAITYADIFLTRKVYNFLDITMLVSEELFKRERRSAEKVVQSDLEFLIRDKAFVEV